MDRMSPQDAAFLHIEDDRTHMHVAFLAIFEGPPPERDEFTRMVQGKLPLVPRYRQKVRFVPFEAGRPVWVDDPHFNIDYHVRHTAVPSPGSEGQLRNLVGRRVRTSRCGRGGRSSASRPTSPAPSRRCRSWPARFPRRPSTGRSARTGAGRGSACALTT